MNERSEVDERDLRVFWVLIGLAGGALFAAALAGVAWGISAPEDGSAAHDALGAAAAASGLAVAVLAGAAAIWAQVRNLWRFAPRWFQYTTWVVLATMIVVVLASGGARGE